MTIQQFIEKAIKGGWKPKWLSEDILEQSQGEFIFPYYFNSRTLLDPKAWQAVVRVDQKKKIEAGYEVSEQFIKDVAQARMHRMIDALCEGKSLEEYIATL
jgi:hypothetical protein